MAVRIQESSSPSSSEVDSVNKLPCPADGIDGFKEFLLGDRNFDLNKQRVRRRDLSHRGRFSDGSSYDIWESASSFEPKSGLLKKPTAVMNK